MSDILIFVLIVWCIYFAVELFRHDKDTGIVTITDKQIEELKSYRKLFELVEGISQASPDEMADIMVNTLTEIEIHKNTYG